MQVAKDPIELCLLELLLKIMIGQENDVKFDEKAKHGSARSHYQAVQVATFERQ